MTTYSGRLIREQGASVLTVASGGSINVDAGGLLTIASGANLSLPSGANIAASGLLNFSGGVTFGQASQTQVAGGAILLAVGASMNVNVTTNDAGTFRITDGTRAPTVGTGRNIPTHAASPGSIFLRSDGSMSAMYWNDSDGTSGSVWKTAASSSTGAPG